MTLKKLPVNVSSFNDIRSKDYLYVDKTQQIYNIINSEANLFFLSRPRRFGKTLLISTLEELFSGNKKLFADLWIDKINYEWSSYPVIKLDFSGSSNAQTLQERLLANLKNIAKQSNIDISDTRSLVVTLETIIISLSKINKVVILIDEYDYPLLKNIAKQEQASQIREIIQDFFATIKSNQTYIRFLFITGVSKFSKTSLFSGLNNLVDLSQDPLAADLLGYTQEELEVNYQPHINTIAQAEATSPQEVLKRMQLWYNGYRFTKAPVKVYNPFSINLACFKKEISNYWIESGTPSFLVTMLAKETLPLTDVQGARLKTSGLSSFDIDTVSLYPLLFQTGYLTIQDYDAQTQEYILGYPNQEVSEAFKEYLIAAFAHTSGATISVSMQRLHKALQENNMQLLCDTLQSLFAHIPYQLHIPQERYYHSLFQMIGTMLGADIHSETSTDKGRIDVVITTAPYLYIIEIKFNSTPQVALEQIQERRYYDPTSPRLRRTGRYVLDDRQLVLAGIAFNRHNNHLWIEYESKSLEDTSA